MLVIFLAGFLPLTESALFLTPPENRWVREGEENVTLLCEASETIRACSWSTPYGKTYPLESGLTAESGRLKYSATDKSVQCGVTIQNVQKKDEGRWRCNIGVVDNAEVRTASGMANLSIAVAPEDVRLEPPFNKLTVNVTAGAKTPIVCTVENTKPAATFQWTIDGTPVEGETRDEEKYVDASGISTFSQTLHLIISTDYHNKTITCSVSHPGLTKSVGVHTILLVTGGALGAYGSGLPAGAIVGLVIAAIITIVISVLLAMLYRGKFNQRDTESNGRLEDGANNEEKDTENKDEVKDENNEETEQQEDKKKSWLSDKFASMMTRLSNKNLDDTVAQEFEKVDLSDGEEKKDEEKKVERNFSGQARSFFSRFSKKSAKEEMELEPEVEKTAEQVKEESQTEKPAEKPEANGHKIGSETPV